MDSAEVCARREHLLAVLDLIDEHVCPPSVILDSAFDVCEKLNGILQRLGAGVLKVDFDDVVFHDAAFHEVPFEKVEKEEALAASPDSSDDFHEVIVLRIYYAFQQKIAFDGHGVSVVCDFMDLSKNLKSAGVYHNLRSKARVPLEISWTYPEKIKLNAGWRRESSRAARASRKVVMSSAHAVSRMSHKPAAWKAASPGNGGHKREDCAAARPQGFVISKSRLVFGKRIGYNVRK